MRRFLSFSAAALAVVCALLVATAGATRTASPGASGKIAFMRGPAQVELQAPREIWVMNADGTGQTQLTTSGNNGWPTWSPDGTKIAYMGNGDGVRGIYVMAADGTGQTRIQSGGWLAAWSPDGTKIAYVDYPGDYEIYVMNADGTNQTRLTDSPGDDLDPSWSPDGKKIVFVSERDTNNGNGEVYVMNADGTDQTRLTDSFVQDQDPAWSPDGTKIAWRGAGLMLMNADGSDQTTLTTSQSVSHIAWSPDGTKIAFQDDPDYLNFDIYVMNFDGSGLTRLTDDPGSDWAPAWQPSVTDVVPPLVSVPQDMALEATGTDGAAASLTVSATDLKDGPVSPKCDRNSGELFPLGATTVTCTASDAAGNTGSASFTVNVVDTTPPVLSVPADISAEATGPAGAVVSFTPIASDLADASPTVICLPASGGMFPLGATTVSCVASDHANPANASAMQTFEVTVGDATGPALTVPTDMTVEATGASGAAVSFTATALDLLSGSLTPSCTPSSGATFPLGPTTVTCSATDAAGNPGSASFKVTVVDTTPPAVSVPAAKTVDATTPTGAVVTFTASATDLVDGSLAAGCSPVSGSLFPVGLATQVTCGATDAHGNYGSASFSITVLNPQQQIVSVRETVTQLNAKEGIVGSLDAKLAALEDALTALNAGNRGDACNKLKAFEQAVTAQTGKGLTLDDAGMLLDRAHNLEGALGCTF